jgi:hypothetical protein
MFKQYPLKNHLTLYASNRIEADINLIEKFSPHTGKHLNMLKICTHRKSFRAINPFKQY